MTVRLEKDRPGGTRESKFPVAKPQLARRLIRGGSRTNRIWLDCLEDNTAKGTFRSRSFSVCSSGYDLAVGRYCTSVHRFSQPHQANLVPGLPPASHRRNPAWMERSTVVGLVKLGRRYFGVPPTMLLAFPARARLSSLILSQHPAPNADVDLTSTPFPRLPPPFALPLAKNQRIPDPPFAAGSSHTFQSPGQLRRRVNMTPPKVQQTPTTTV